jgi:hypothetical protein
MEPMVKKDITAFDKVQRKCEKLCTEDITFEPLAQRRRRTDLVETYKFINSRYKIDPLSLFRLADNYEDIKTRFSSLQLGLKYRNISSCTEWSIPGTCFRQTSWEQILWTPSGED